MPDPATPVSIQLNLQLFGTLQVAATAAALSKYSRLSRLEARIQPVKQATLLSGWCVAYLLSKSHEYTIMISFAVVFDPFDKELIFAAGYDSIHFLLKAAWHFVNRRHSYLELQESNAAANLQWPRRRCFHCSSDAERRGFWIARVTNSLTHKA